MQGKIKAITSKGYGWIETPQQIDFFLHHKDFIGDWKQLLLDFVNKKEILVEFENDSKAVRGPKVINCRVIPSGGI